jgi:molybdate transport system substrate-binding protein
LYGSHAPTPAVSSVEEFPATVVAAPSVAYSDPPLAPSGVHSTGVFERLGIAETIRPKTISRTPFDGGVALVAKGEVALGIDLVTQIKMTEHVVLAGLLPPELQTYVAYAGSVAADSPVSEAARAFLSFLTDPVAPQYWKAAGLESSGAVK